MANETCPICGSPLRGGNTYELRDSMICSRCSEDLRFLYPILYLPAPPRGKPQIGELPQCRELSRKEQKFLRDHMQEGRAFPATYLLDRMCLLTLEQFRTLLTSADALEDRIRAGYLDYTNVCTVDFARPLERTVGRAGIQHLRKRQRGFCITGMIRAGKFRDGDMVGIYHQGQLRYADILGMDYEDNICHPQDGECRTRRAEAIGDAGDRGTAIRAGYQVTMVLNDKARGIQAGDWIVLD